MLILSWGGSYIDAQELFLQHMILGCNCIYKHLVGTQNNVVGFLENLLLRDGWTFQNILVSAVLTQL